MIMEKSDVRAGDVVYFNLNGKMLSATVTRVNQKTLSLRLPDGRQGKISPNLATKDKNASPEQEIKDAAKNLPRSDIDTEAELNVLLNQVRDEYEDVFSSLDMPDKEAVLSCTEIEWGTRETCVKGGHYSRRTNSIMITKSLENTPDWVIKKVIFHECLHVFIPNHGAEFRALEKKYKRFDDATNYIRVLFSAKKVGKTRQPRRKPVPASAPPTEDDMSRMLRDLGIEFL